MTVAIPAYTPAEATAALHEALLVPMNGITAPDVDLIRDLIAQGADLEARDADGMTALLRCLSWECPASNRGGIVSDMHSLLSLLLRKGADLEAVLHDGTSAADLASKWRDGQQAFMKLDREAYRRTDPKLMAEVSEISPSWPKPGEAVTDQIKDTFLTACSAGFMDIVRYTLYIYPDAVNWYLPEFGGSGFTPLMATVNPDGRATEVANLLIERGASVNLQNESGMTALHYAVTQDHGGPEFIDILITAGADARIKNTDGLDAMAHAEMQENEVFIERLKAALETRDAMRATAEENKTRERTATRMDALRNLRARGGKRFKL